MHVACDKGHYKIVQLLLDHGVQVDIADEVSDISYIHVVSYVIQPKIIKLLWSKMNVLSVWYNDWSNILAKNHLLI